MEINTDPKVGVSCVATNTSMTCSPDGGKPPTGRELKMTVNSTWLFSPKS
jgi:hypothetical protein